MQTSALHQRLDSQPLLRALLAPQISAARHRRVLYLFAAGYAHIDAALLAAEPADLAGTVHGYRARGDWLPKTVDTAAEPTNRPELDGPAYWGARYVVEGATRGARVILQQLTRHDRLDPEDLRFWRRQVEIGAHWPELRTLLDQRLAEPQSLADALQGATATFDWFIDIFAAGNDAHA